MIYDHDGMSDFNPGNRDPKVALTLMQEIQNAAAQPRSEFVVQAMLRERAAYIKNAYNHMTRIPLMEVNWWDRYPSPIAALQLPGKENGSNMTCVNGKCLSLQ